MTRGFTADCGCSNLARLKLCARVELDLILNFGQNAIKASCYMYHCRIFTYLLLNLAAALQPAFALGPIASATSCNQPDDADDYERFSGSDNWHRHYISIVSGPFISTVCSLSAWKQCDHTSAMVYWNLVLSA